MLNTEDIINIGKDSASVAAQKEIIKVIGDTTATASEKITEIAHTVKSLTISDMANIVLDIVTRFGLKLLAAIAIFIVGRWVIKRLKKVIHKILEKQKVEKSVTTFIDSLISISLNLIFIILLISVLGVNTTSFVALFASAGLAIGMALSGTLQNFAGGVLILFFKPYKVGDIIETQGQLGTVMQIQIFNTIINTFDNEVIIIPNGPVSTGILKNYSSEDLRRVDWTIGISYGDDFETAKATLLELFAKDPRIKKDPAPFVSISALADSSVNVAARAWVKSSEYFDVFFDMNVEIYKVFPNKGLNFPFPQLQIHTNSKD